MIVCCARCQAKFRVSDQKVGPRGAKVRCSRCQTVFLIRRDQGTSSSDAAPVPAGAPAAPSPAPPFSSSGVAPRARSLGLDLESGAHPEPFAWNGAAPPPDALSAPDDPFAVAPAAPAPTRPTSSAPVDPFGPNPFSSAPAPQAIPFSAAPAEDRFSLASGGLGTVGVVDPFVAAVVPRATPPGQGSSAEGAERGLLSEDSLSLEERTAARPLPAPMADAESLALGSEGWAGLDPFSSAPPGEPEEIGDDEFQEVPREEEPFAPRTARALARSAVPAPPRRAPAPRAVADSAAAESEPASRAPRLRALVVNAVALVALLLVALALLVVWRGGGPLGVWAFRPSAVLAALGRGDPSLFTTKDLTSGAYERAKGAPLLFVRGRVVSRASAPVAAVRVAVEVVRGGDVVARGEGIAGAVPTPEELWLAGDGAELEALARAAAARAPRQVRPGDAVPFLVAIAGGPMDPAGATLRVTASAVPKH